MNEIKKIKNKETTISNLKKWNSVFGFHFLLVIISDSLYSPQKVYA